MSENELFIIIPVHNRRHFTQACLASLHAQTRTDFTVIVVDDGSTDGTRAMIEAEFPATVILEGDGNFYWTRATNLGVEYALAQGAAWVMTLNDDTVAPPEFIANMLSWAARYPRALLGAAALDQQTHEFVYGGERGDWRTGTLLLDILTPAERHGLHRVTQFPGRGLLIPAVVFDTIGRFDQRHFPQCAADEDFTLRAARAGFQIYCNYDSPLLIRTGESTGAMLRAHYSLRNYWQYLFGLKSNANLKFYTILVVKNCPPTRMPRALAVGWAARLLGYLRDWVRSEHVKTDTQAAHKDHKP